MVPMAISKSHAPATARPGIKKGERERKREGEREHRARENQFPKVLCSALPAVLSSHVRSSAWRLGREQVQSCSHTHTHTHTLARTHLHTHTHTHVHTHTLTQRKMYVM